MHIYFAYVFQLSGSSKVLRVVCVPKKQDVTKFVVYHMIVTLPMVAAGYV